MSIESIGNKNPQEAVYPGFGTVKQSQSCFTVANKIGNASKEIFIVLAAAFAGIVAAVVTAVPIALLAPLGIIPAIAIGMGVGVVIAGTTFLSIQLIRLIWDRCHRHNFSNSIEKQLIEAHENNAPKLGQTCFSDLIPSTNVEDTLYWRKELIQSATSSIEWSFNFAGGKTFQEVLKLIENRMSECNSLKTHLILSHDLLTKEDHKLLKKFKTHIQTAFFISLQNDITRHNLSSGQKQTTLNSSWWMDGISLLAAQAF